MAPGGAVQADEDVVAVRPAESVAAFGEGGRGGAGNGRVKMTILPKSAQGQPAPKKATD